MNQLDSNADTYLRVNEADVSSSFSQCNSEKRLLPCM